MSKELTYSQILVEHLGGLGRWQIWILSLLWIIDLFDSSKSLIQTVGAYKPPYRCFIEGCDTNASLYHEPWYEAFENGAHADTWKDQECGKLVDLSSGNTVALCNANLNELNREVMASW